MCVCLCARFAWSPAPPGWGCCAGVFGWAWAGGAPRHSWLGRWGVCLFVCAPCLYPAFPCCVGVRAGLGFRLCPALLGSAVGVCVRSCVCPACPRPSWGAACGGVRVLPFMRFAPPLPVNFGFFLGGGRVVSWLCGVGRLLSRSWVSWSLSPHTLSSGLRCLFFFFSSEHGVCPRVLGVPFPVGPLLPAWCCPFCLGGPPALCGVLSSVTSGWGLWPPLAVLVGGLVAGRAPPPFFNFFWGGVCLFLPLPSLGWRTHWSAFSVGFRVAVGGCVLPGRAPAQWVGWVMYTFGSAPLPAGLDSGSAGWALHQAASCGPGLGGWGCSVSFRLHGAGFNFLAVVCVGGPPSLLPGVRWPLAGVWRAGSVPSGVCGGLFWLDLRLVSLALVLWCAVVRRVAPCGAVVCRSVPRSVASCCGVLVRFLPGCAVACFG